MFGLCQQRHSNKSNTTIQPLRRYRLWLLVMTCIFISGCSFVRLGLSQLDTLIYWQTDKYFDLTNEQSDWLEPEIDIYINWLKQEQTPLLVAQLTTFRNDPTPETLAELNQWLLDFWVEASIYIWPVSQRLMADLSEEQIDHLERSLEKEGRKRYKKDKTIEKQYKERVKRRTEWLEDWFGDLTDQQLELIKATTSPPMDELALWRDHNATLQKRFVGSIKQGDWFELERWFAETERWYSPEYLDYRLQQRAEIEQLFENLWPTLTAEQRTYFDKELAWWIDVFEDFADISE